MSNSYYKEFKEYEKNQSFTSDTKNYKLIKFIEKILDETEILEFYPQSADKPEFIVLVNNKILKFVYIENSGIQLSEFPIRTIRKSVFFESLDNNEQVVITFIDRGEELVLTSNNEHENKRLISFVKRLVQSS